MRGKIKFLMRRIWDVIGAVGVRTKIMGIVLGLVLVLGLGITFQVRATLTQALSRELEQRGISVTRDLAARSTDLILTNNLFALHELLRDTVENNEDLRYAFILGKDNQVLIHSFVHDVPLDLLAVNQVRSDQHHGLELLQTEEGVIRDVAVPIFEGRVGTARLGLSERRLRERVTTVTRQLLLTTLLVSLIGVLGGYLLAWVLTRPVQTLVEVTQALARGDMSRKAPRWANDEIGALGTAFNAMIDDLAQAEQERAAYNTQLERRNRELSALNIVAQTVSGPLSLSEALERALEQVLGVVDSEAGWICLLEEEEDGACRAFAGMRALCRPQVGGEPRPCRWECGCRRAIDTGQPMLIHPLATDCLLLDVEMEGCWPTVCHVAVPLLVKARAVGLLNVVCQDGTCLEPADLDLLGAVGQQLGVAIENTRLWEEVRRKEALRGELLKKVITAQEEERRRIARELHDETGQALTSLMVGLRVLEGAACLEEVWDTTDKLRTMAAQTLDNLHSLALELRPSVLDDSGLVAALRRYVKDYATGFALDADFEVVGLEDKRLTPEVETTLYRIVQEALTNVARHAEASQVSVLLEQRGDSVIGIVEDDGQGFDVEGVLTLRQLKRLGLHGMQERASLVGGKLTVESTPGIGTTVFIEIPLDGVP